MLFQARNNLCSLSGCLDFRPGKTNYFQLLILHPNILFGCYFILFSLPPPFLGFQLCTCVDESFTLYNVCGSLCTPAEPDIPAPQVCITSVKIINNHLGQILWCLPFVHWPFSGFFARRRTGFPCLPSIRLTTVTSILNDSSSKVRGRQCLGGVH